MFKRSVDIALGGFLLIVSLPFLVIAAVLIKLDSTGPVIFRQLRVGRKYICFELLKLRTMRHSTVGSLYTLGADPRITRVGRWLRRFKVDELPQLWNVLRGDMSLVGPRPVVPELVLEFNLSYDRLLSVRPGLTDPATVKYCREDEMLARVPDPLRHFKAVVTPDKLRISLAYLRRATIWSDLGVMARTAAALLQAFRLQGRGQLAFVQAGRGRLLEFPAAGCGRTRAREQKVVWIAEPVEVDQGGVEIGLYRGQMASNLLMYRDPRQQDRSMG